MVTAIEVGNAVRDLFAAKYRAQRVPLVTAKLWAHYYGAQAHFAFALRLALQQKKMVDALALIEPKPPTKAIK